VRWGKVNKDRLGSPHQNWNEAHEKSETKLKSVICVESPKIEIQIFSNSQYTRSRLMWSFWDKEKLITRSTTFYYVTHYKYLKNFATLILLSNINIIHKINFWHYYSHTHFLMINNFIWKFVGFFFAFQCSVIVKYEEFCVILN
jgi:hypothetical protein